MTRRGVYPGSFSPPTVAHLAIAEAAREQRELDVVVFMVSRQALAKESVTHPLLNHRLEVLTESVAEHDWLTVSVTDRQLLADVADGFDVLIMGADKWDQIQQLQWYENHAHRARSLASLPELAVAPRPPIPIDGSHLLAVDVHATSSVSSTAARDGALELMLPAARDFAQRTGAWINPPRYDVWLAGVEGPLA
jgi:nicotinic acid mononucleotide adenylyltransferase